MKWARSRGRHTGGRLRYARLNHDLTTSERSFRVVGGWSAQRSHDAYQAERVRGDDSLSPHVDYRALESRNQNGFREHDSRFMIASFACGPGTRHGAFVAARFS